MRLTNLPSLNKETWEGYWSTWFMILKDNKDHDTLIQEIQALLGKLKDWELESHFSMSILWLQI